LFWPNADDQQTSSQALYPQAAVDVMVLTGGFFLSEIGSPMYTKKILSMFSKTLLIVDDTPLFVRLAKDLFRREQIDILTAHSGPEAVEIAKRNKTDLILMDLYMTEGDGDDACRQIKNDPDLRSTPIVMMTSSNDPKDLQRCKAAGCDEVIHKPLTRENVLRISKKYLNLPGWSGKRSPINTPAKFGKNVQQMSSGTLLDISVGGVFLATEEYFEMGSELFLEFQLSQEKARISCRGQVAWVNRKDNFKNHTSSGMGIEFVDIQKLDILSIQAWVRNESST
jgi:CheY-like chemotaxis protein